MDIPTSGVCVCDVCVGVYGCGCGCHASPLTFHPSRICTQIPGEWLRQSSSAEASLLSLVHSIVVYCLDHSSESEAVDLLQEIDRVALLKEVVKEDTYQRVCLYLTRSAVVCVCVGTPPLAHPSSCVKYVPEPEDGILMHTALDIYRQFQQYPHALRLAMMLNDITLVKKLFLNCPDRSELTLSNPISL